MLSPCFVLDHAQGNPMADASPYRLTGLGLVSSLSTVHLGFHKLAISLVMAPQLLDLYIFRSCHYCAFLYLYNFPSLSELALWVAPATLRSKTRFYTCA